MRPGLQAAALFDQSAQIAGLLAVGGGSDRLRGYTCQMSVLESGE
jgi:hypothetical protein